MAKIRLDLDELKVESFVTSGAAMPDGTVFGMAYTDCQETCAGAGNTCDGQNGCDSDPGMECAGYTDPAGESCVGEPPTLPAWCGGPGTDDVTPESCDGFECEPE